MARQLQCDLVDLIYIMDEPSVGLHPHDISRLIALLLELRDRGKNIFDILETSVTDGLEHFRNEQILKRLRLLDDVGLGYLKIGQPLSTLSGGEAQRIKLTPELHKQGALYVLDEPTIGLHRADIC